MNIQLQANQLRYEMVRRNLSVVELARAARLSHPTICHALAGRAISSYSLQQIAQALEDTPVVAMIDRLLPAARDGQQVV